MGVELDTSTNAFGDLRPSEHLIHDGAALRQRMQEDGYLYLPGCVDREKVLQVRREVLEQLQKQDVLDPDFPMMEGVCRPEVKINFSPELVVHNPTIREILYGGPLMETMERFFEEPVKHFDYTWFRTMGPGQATPPHCDIVFMGRGTDQLYTVWVPYGDISLELGGLMLLENSHLQTPQLAAEYLKKDVDTYCTNQPAPETPKPNHWLFDGALSHDPVQVRESFGGRWLSTAYQPGDVVIFGMAMVHAGLDNHTRRVRLSSDSRYQRASEPADERWIGPNPPGHGPHVHRGVIC
jgi:hypothetical protein